MAGSPPSPLDTRCGTVAIVGRPNAGKSTLLNALIGERLAIVSPRAQSTRLPVVGLLTRDGTQAILVDTPGLLEPGYALHRAMLQSIAESLRDADLILHLIDATAPQPDALPEVCRRLGLTLDAARIFTVWSKSDAPGAQPAPDGFFTLAARSPRSVDALWKVIRSSLPPGTFRYPEDDVSTQAMRFFVTEAIREAAFDQLRDELPYAIHCDVDEFREGSTPTYIRATLHVERDSQKGIVLGKGGAQLRALGTAARQRLEPLVGGAVYLDLWVKVLKDWRRDPAVLRRLGFSLPDERQ